MGENRVISFLRCLSQTGSSHLIFEMPPGLPTVVPFTDRVCLSYPCDNPSCTALSVGVFTVFSTDGGRVAKLCRTCYDDEATLVSFLARLSSGDNTTGCFPTARVPSLHKELMAFRMWAGPSGEELRLFRPFAPRSLSGVLQVVAHRFVAAGDHPLWPAETVGVPLAPLATLWVTTQAADGRWTPASVLLADFLRWNGLDQALNREPIFCLHQ